MAKFYTYPNSKHISKTNVAKMIISLFVSVENIVRKEKCWFPAFSPFPVMFSKASLVRAVECWDCDGKG